MDLFNRAVVHAKGGNRKEYMPVSASSMVCDTSDPVRLIETLKPREIYIADLNVLQGIGPRAINASLIQAVSSKIDTMLDFGVSTPPEALDALSLAGTAIIGTETGCLKTIREAALANPGKISVSIDVKHKKLLKTDPALPEDPFEIVKLLNELPLKDFIFLDLDRVGTASGFDPDFLKQLAAISKYDVLLGGGVRSMEDLLTLEKLGIRGALVATAVHSGAIPLEVLRSSQLR